MTRCSVNDGDRGAVSRLLDHSIQIISKAFVQERLSPKLFDPYKRFITISCFHCTFFPQKIKEEDHSHDLPRPPPICGLTAAHRTQRSHAHTQTHIHTQHCVSVSDDGNNNNHVTPQAPPVVACGGGGGVMCWSYEEVHAGTKGFSPALQVGEGGFGVVYRATLGNTDCAIKKLKQVSQLLHRTHTGPVRECLGC